ncbi:MAG: phosphoribosylformylglycinamidine synthase subunit PurQ, partial [Eudoraea sp.]|uniref:phosphoribosylformylglycinamidine synthase subunit PurQ n=1 Tax=Eudoraea sp. TaxID=1979955 RepID=UPI003C73DCCD
ALTNIVWAPLKDGIKSVALSANWMWPCRNEGEDARLYEAVEAVSDFAIALGINVPTGKDSLSMKQKYQNEEVISPGTVIISSAASCSDITKVVEPVFQKNGGAIYYLNLSADSHNLGGSSFAQIINKVGEKAPDVKDIDLFKRAFDAIQELINNDKLAAGHDIASGGLITTLLEMCFAETSLGAELDMSHIGESDLIKLLFSENTGVIIQAKDEAVEVVLNSFKIPFYKIGEVTNTPELKIKNNSVELGLNISSLRDTWFKTSYLLDEKQTAKGLAKERFDNYKNQPLQFSFPERYQNKLPLISSKGPRPKAAILREKGSNSEREMANAMYLAGFDVKDVHMTDLISGRETLEDISFVGAVGGFSNSDVLGSAKGWAGAFKYNEKAKNALRSFFNRSDTLSVGICNGCQLFMELELINPEHKEHGKMDFNDSHKHESGFTSVKIQENNSIMLSSLAGAKLGVWISHGEGKFRLPESKESYEIVGTYGYTAYPSNPNGSDYNTAMLCDKSGRHLVTMPHIERSIFPWNWAHYPKEKIDEVSPWLEAFINARKWVEKHPKK